MKSDLRLKQATPRNPLWEQVLHDLSRFARRDRTNPRRSALYQSTGFQLEAVEPRLLMSADLSYAATSSVHDFTLRASGPATVNLLDTSNSSIIASGTVQAGQTTITVERANTLGAQSLSADTLHIDLKSFSSINATVGTGTLGITFTGASNSLFTDHVFLDGGAAATPATLGYGLSLTSDSSIAIGGTASFGGDTTIKSEQIQSGGAVPGTGLLANANSSIIVNGANLTDTGHKLTLEAHSSATVNDDGLGGKTISGSIVTSQDTAAVDIHTGSVLHAADVAITSDIDASLTASVSNAGATIKILAVGGYARPEVTIDGGSQVTADNTLSVKATTDVTTSAVAMPDAAHPNTDSKVDAADATTVFENSSNVTAAGGAVLTATSGAASLFASDKLVATTTADASVGSAAGATLASSIITGDTTAAVDGAHVTGVGVSVVADTSRTITTHAMSSSGGAAPDASGAAPDSAGSNKSEDALHDNKAASSDGNLTVAGAVAVGVDTGTTSAYLKNATVNAGQAGTAAVTAASLDNMDVNANGSFTGSGSTGVGVGAAVTTGVRSDLAYLTGTTDDVTAGSLNVTVAPLNGAQSSFGATATSGVGDSSKVGIAGSLALNINIFDHQAYLDTGTALALHGTTPNAAFGATDSVANNASATPADGGGTAGKVGIGASVAFNYVQDTTYGFIGDSATLTGANDLGLTADSTHTAETDGKGGGAGGTAITPVVAITIADDDTKATLGSGSALNLSGSLTASSSLADTVGTTTEGDTKSGKTGVGISVSVTVVNDTSLATTARNLIAASGAVSFLSNAASGSQSAAKASVAGGEQDDGNNDQQVDKKATDQKTFADKSAADHATTAKAGTATKGTEAAKEPSAATSDGSVSVAGAFAVNVEQSSSQAYLDGGHTVQAGGVLALKATSNVDGAASADGSAVQGQAEFDPTAAGIVDTAGDTITLGTSTGLKTGAKVTYGHGDGGTDIGGLTDGTDYYVFDAGGGKFKFYDTAANANTHAAAGLVDITSAGTGTKQVFKGAGEAGTSVGVGVSVNYASATNLAYIGNATVTAGGLDIEATEGTRTLAFDPATAVDTVKDTLNAGQTNLRTGDSVTYHNGGGTSVGGLVDGTTYYVNVQADHSLKLYDTGEDATAGAATGLVALTAGATGTAHSLTEATNAFAAEATSGAGGGKTGVAGSLAINLGFTDTEAVLGYNATTPSHHAGWRQCHGEGRLGQRGRRFRQAVRWRRRRQQGRRRHLGRVQLRRERHAGDSSPMA